MSIRQHLKGQTSVIAGALLCILFASAACVHAVYSAIAQEVGVSVLDGVTESLSDEATVRQLLLSDAVTSDMIDKMLRDDGARVRAAIASENPEDRLGATIILGEVGPKAAPFVPLLSGALKDQNVEVRRQAAYALGEIGAAAEPSLQRLRDLVVAGDDRVRNEAAKAIKKIVGEPATDC